MFPKLEPEVEREVSEMLKRASSGRAPLETVDTNVAIATSPGMAVPGAAGTATSISSGCGDAGATLAEQERARVRRDVLDDEEVYVYTVRRGRVAGVCSTAARRASAGVTIGRDFTHARDDSL